MVHEVDQVTNTPVDACVVRVVACVVRVDAFDVLNIGCFGMLRQGFGIWYQVFENE